MLSAQDQYRLSGETGIHPRTVARWVENSIVAEGTDYALRAACAKLDLTPPDRESGAGADTIEVA